MCKEDIFKTVLIMFSVSSMNSPPALIDGLLFYRNVNYNLLADFNISDTHQSSFYAFSLTLLSRTKGYF